VWHAKCLFAEKGYEPTAAGGSLEGFEKRRVRGKLNLRTHGVKHSGRGSAFLKKGFKKQRWGKPAQPEKSLCGCEGGLTRGRGGTGAATAAGLVKGGQRCSQSSQGGEFGREGQCLLRNAAVPPGRGLLSVGSPTMTTRLGGGNFWGKGNLSRDGSFQKKGRMRPSGKHYLSLRGLSI